MRGKWHLIAVSAIIGIIAITLRLLFLYGIFFLWLYLLFKNKRIRIVDIMIMCSTCFIFSFYYYPSNQNKILDGEVQDFMGTITSEIDSTPLKTSFVFHDAITNQDLLVTNFKNEEDLSSSTTWKTGATCQLQGSPEIPPVSKNPGQFNYQEYLFKQKITYLITIEQSDLKCTGSSFENELFTLRKNIIVKIEREISSFASGWLQALLLGRDALIDEKAINVFERWGLSHLLAISGLHVGLISSFVYFILIKTGMVTKEKAFYLLLALLMVYPFISGGAPSVWRAAWMTILGFIMMKNKINLGMIDSLSIVFFICVLFDKQIIYQLGFQFSFLVTLSILLSKHFITRSSGKLNLIFRISFISLVSVLPIQIAHFYFLNPLSLILNTIVVPYFSIIVMPVLFLMLLSIYFFPFLTTLIDSTFIHLHQPALSIIEWIDQKWYYPWIIGEFPIYYYIPYYLCLFFLFIALDDKKKRMAILNGLVLIGLVFWIACRPYINGNGTITMLDVGQGDSIIIELPYRKGVIVIDAAGTMESDFKTPSDRTYQQVIKPYLYSRGIGNIDLVVLSHADHDHIGSLPFLLEEFPVQRIVTSTYFTPPQELANVIKKEEINWDYLKKDEHFMIDQQQFYVMHPEVNQEAENDNSLVIASKIGSLMWLFTGDISADVEQILVKNYPNIKVDVLKVAHHGSHSSTSSSFLQAFRPQIALISVGENNQYNHPDQDVIERLSKENIIIYRTDKQGAIQYTYKNTGDQGTFSSFLP
ncbi:DNA internalization-related competence protein ComEC/Rec2 [Paraliobacillus sp. X-1268]|uniref:DNA internalization-related competence protein ComEC/Rec2 n=1 Tax=Paraliobacillus sp. X-1268 TaxID=2213193 RepID=UPI001300836C|nr:DNA internalization-related competence protein ComEC/Rec2 [Paraliobacillus sp. X-1268]